MLGLYEITDAVYYRGRVNSEQWTVKTDSKGRSMAESYETIAKALFVNYESIYDIDMDSGAYYCFHQSETYEKHNLEKRGDDFFNELKKTVPRVVAPEDQDYVLRMLSKKALYEGTQ